MQSEVDVLVIGAGPAGALLSFALARAGVNVRVVDKREVRISAGHADGIQPRTMEIFQSYGLSTRFMEKAAQIHMMAYYNPGPDGGIVRTEMGPFAFQGTTAGYPFVATLGQTEIEGLFRDGMKEFGVGVEQHVAPISMVLSENETESQDPQSYPVKVVLRRLTESTSSEQLPRESMNEVVRAKYVVGADGAHSWIRKTLGIEMIGESTDFVWGVLDCVPETDLPDIRIYCAVHSHHGSCAIVPREGDLVRIYVQLAEVGVDETGRLDKSKFGPEDIIRIAQKCLHPYKLAFPKVIKWWTVYIIGQRVASTFSVKDRTFIAGDACHTHSPKAGQGMNASMGDAHNLAWKLAYVLRGWAPSPLLKTYELERRKYAQDLIDFDKIFARLYSTRPKIGESSEGITHEQFAQAVDQFSAFSSGIGVLYEPSNITDISNRLAAKNLVIGQRMLPGVILRMANFRPCELHELLPSDTRFKILIFPGDFSNSKQKAKLDAIALSLEQPQGLLKRFTPSGASEDTVFDIITISRVDNATANILMIPPRLLSHWTKAYNDGVSICGLKGGNFYAGYGISEAGAIVICRPDGYVGMVAELDDLAAVEDYFARFLKSSIVV
ncbi:hypothetical protein BOTBODRAFT_126399 [Botryobasidium botryosum FD-172 SS1]|uniref:FAD-binding domain-containing protein n=1 Tax=Botryobasidium botryosum (strain FD-172 SS1) TaxID=930990 RepID=A0A067MV97_BOTB1|nr:hypothetical protein BOTBODRAFT_126399 [Botryobasidium botryosum FD-172 SS1]